MDSEAYRRLDALEIRDIVCSGQVSACEVTEAALKVIAALNPKLNAVVLADPERSLAEAEQVDPAAPLAGVPILIKDNNLFIDGWPTTFSSKLYEGVAPRFPESTIIRRLRAAGCVILGKTNTPEFATDWTTEPTWRGPTRNPWNLDHSPGGSSGGSAAAVASGMAPAGHGNDNGGSIRIPAAVCGLVGLKPTRGLVPIGPAFPELAAGLNSEHVLTRSVRDSAAFLDTLAGPEPGGQYRIEKSVPSYLEALERPVGRLSIGCVTARPDGSAIDPEIAAAVERVARLLERAGHSVRPARFPSHPDFGRAAEAVYFADTALLVRERARELGREARRDELEAISRYSIERTGALDVVDYLEARHTLHRIAAGFTGELLAFDALLSPTTAETAPKLGVLDTRTAAFDYDRLIERAGRFAPFSDIFNVTGQPAASVPAGRARSGLPIGVQVSAVQGRDDLVLGLCGLIECTLDLDPADQFPEL